MGRTPYIIDPAVPTRFDFINGKSLPDESLEQAARRIISKQTMGFVPTDPDSLEYAGSYKIPQLERYMVMFDLETTIEVKDFKKFARSKPHQTPLDELAYISITNILNFKHETIDVDGQEVLISINTIENMKRL